jgi:hypothetical protein
VPAGDGSFVTLELPDDTVVNDTLDPWAGIEDELTDQDDPWADLAAEAGSTSGGDTDPAAEAKPDRR